MQNEGAGRHPSMQQPHPSHSGLRILHAAPLLLLLTGCSILGIRGQVSQFKDLVAYAGTAERVAPSKTPLIVVLYDETSRDVIFYDLLLKDGPYYLVAPPGNYRVLAFDDRNRNFVLDANEPVGMLDAAPVDTGLDTSARGKIIVGAHRDPQAPAVDLSPTGLPAIVQRRADALGRVVTLDEPMFEAGNAVQGLWKPAEFTKEGRTGLYMLEPYDPKKIPVLFIHGIGGSPRELRSIANGLDRTRFQPWFFHYPSGFSLDANGWILAQLVEESRGRLGFARMHLVAHSMGGLVAASFLDWRAKDGQAPLVDLVVTISTPWLGSSSAAKAPSGLAMPSWKDITPDSEFMQRLAALEFVDDAEYCLLFSHAGDSRLMAGGDDGTVTISAQLPYRAENRASFVYGFAENHASILENALLIRMIGQMTRNRADGRAAADGLKELAKQNEPAETKTAQPSTTPSGTIERSHL